MSKEITSQESLSTALFRFNLYVKEDDADDGKYYPVAGKEGIVKEEIDNINFLVNRLGESAPEGLRGMKFAVIYGQVRLVPKDWELKIDNGNIK